MKIITVIGARPQFIKTAAVSRVIAQHSNIEEIIVHTGQHFDANMSDVFFDEMEIPKPKYQLGISGKGHGAMTGEMLSGIEDLCLKEKPDILMVYGDTNSTLAGALAAAKLHIPIAHVEAGLRSFNMRMPEEINRILTDRISKFLFCPTDTAIRNLKNEGYDNFDCHIVKNGDVMYDAAMYYSQNSASKAKIFSSLNLDKFALCTVHRAENTDSIERLSGIFSALREISQKFPVVLPLHPRTRKFIENYKVDTTGIKIIDPVGYFDMIELLKNTSFVITDSGGLQKEAYFFNKACITMRDETEWTELIEVGHNAVVGTSPEKILNAYTEIQTKKATWSQGIYGKGDASDKIVNYLLEHVK
nr:UDP-N-acetylglucosamine 2-epimerase (non-hydrolyzing) [Bdellovibrio sp. CKG001]